jgi:two-component system, LytTR family, sensor histidine kinase AlgZ
MHPVLDSRRHLLVYLLAWLLFGALLAVVFAGGETWLVGVVVFVPLSLAYALVCLSAWYLCRVFPLDPGASTWKVLPVHGLASVLASAIWGAMGTAWARAVDSVAGGSIPGGLGAEQLHADLGPVLFVVGALLYWLAAVFHYLLIAFEASRDAERRALELNLLAREAELKALRAQIDPHFIFNSLHSISALTTTDPVAARRMCLLLADFLRETLRFGATHRISLADEFALADRFLAIEQIRLGARLQVTRIADPDAGDCLVPPLLLQPLVENAVVHGVAQLVDGGTIRMVSKRVGQMLTITLENPCDPERRRTRGVGLGLELLRKRLTTQFGVYDAVLATEEAGHFRVEIRIPAVTAA